MSKLNYDPDNYDQTTLNGYWEAIKNKSNWKMPTKRYKTDDKALAGKLAAACLHFAGGVEIEEEGKFWWINSQGYYHYIGA